MFDLYEPPRPVYISRFKNPKPEATNTQSKPQMDTTDSSSNNSNDNNNSPNGPGSRGSRQGRATGRRGEHRPATTRGRGQVMSPDPSGEAYTPGSDRGAYYHRGGGRNIRGGGRHRNRGPSRGNYNPNRGGERHAILQDHLADQEALGHYHPPMPSPITQCSSSQNKVGTANVNPTPYRSESNKGNATGYMDLMGRDGKMHRWQKPAPKNRKGEASTTPSQTAHLHASANLRTTSDVERTASRLAQSNSSNITQDTAAVARRTAHVASNPEQIPSSRQFPPPPDASSSEDTDNGGGGVALPQSQVAGESTSSGVAGERSWDEDVLDYNGRGGGSRGKGGGYHYW
ncbi:MAG: hypothetical protein Q9213_006822 [Squamulea squamosa]